MRWRRPVAAATALADPPMVSGQSADECMATGQALVASRPARRRGSGELEDANGDLLRFGLALLNKHGVGRNELAQAVATACGVPVADSSIDVARRGDRHPLPRRGRPQAQGDADRRRGRDGRAVRRRPVAGTAPDGRAGHRPEVRLEGLRRQDGHVVHRADVPLDRRRRPPRRPVRRRGRRPSGRRGDRRGQPRRPRPGRAARESHRRPGAARPQLGHPHRTARRPPAHPVPHRRPPRRGVQPPAVGTQRADQPPEDHVGDEHRREAGPAGRPVLDQGRRPPARRPRRLRVDGVRREDRHASARQVEVDGRPR